MSMIGALANLAREEVDTFGLRWRIRKIDNADVMRAGFAGLALMPPEAIAEAARQILQQQAAERLEREQPKKARERAAKQAKGDPVEPTEEQIQEVAYALRHADPDRIAEEQERKEAIVAAGIEALWNPQTSDWEAVECSVTRPTDDSRGILNVRDVPRPAIPVLYEAIWNLSTDDGRTIDWLARFRDEVG